VVSHFRIISVQTYTEQATAQFTHQSTLYFCLFGYNYIKGKVRPRTDNEDPEVELTYSSTLSLTSAIDGGVCQCHAPTSLLPGKETNTRFIRSLVGPGAGLEEGGKRLPHRDSIPRPFSS
jgi:hypothetical protein